MIKKLQVFLQEVQFEFKKISWPNFEELKNSTWIVLGLTGLLALIMFVFDKIFSALVLNLIMGR